MDYQEIIQKNKQLLCRIPGEYKYLNLLFTGEVRTLYFNITRFLNGKKLYICDDKIMFRMNKKQIRALKRNMPVDVMNHHIEYLCAMGLITKEDQDTADSFSFYVLDSADSFMKIERNCDLLCNGNVTTTNINSERIEAAGLNSEAEVETAVEAVEETSVSNEKTAETATVTEPFCEDERLTKISDFIGRSISEKGYCAKTDIVEKVILDQENNEKLIDKLIRKYKDNLHEQFLYKRPTNEEKEQFHLTSSKFIYLERA